MKTLSLFKLSDTTVRYVIDDESGAVGLELHPSGIEDSLVDRSSEKTAPGTPGWAVDPLVHVKLCGDSYPGAFAQGRTMRNSPSNTHFRFEDQTVREDEERTEIRTLLTSAPGWGIEHSLLWRTGDDAFEVTSSFRNHSERPVTLEMLTSFSLGGISPFAAGDGNGRYYVHRFRSVWSAEGRLETRRMEELHLEPSWSGSGAFSERFGQRGTMPVRGWFPFVAVEDRDAGVHWGAQLAWAGSWQMEVFRQQNPVCISGGLADREFGHWMKTLAPGETLEAPPAIVACARGDLDSLCDRLTAFQHRAADRNPEIERDLPVVFNEWCTTWGDPSHEKVAAIARRLNGSGVRYLVIDAGWYKGETGNWNTGHGDWIPSTELFPRGLEAVAEDIREQGLVPGLWFEMETVGDCSTAFSMVDHLLKCDGFPVTVRHRRFWDLNDASAIKYLSDRVIDLLERCGFGYLKVDYNETLGIGCGTAESLGEGLRTQVLGVYRFFELIRERLPKLVIENCSSGGHRLEPSMLGRTAMSSFSDAHETVEIPIIAANLHRLMLPRQSQIWAVLHGEDSESRLVYSLAATFLGRMCLSGDIDRLDSRQWEVVMRARELYSRCAPIIKYGVSRRFAEMGPSWRHPSGWQAVRRVADEGDRALVVIHTFEGAPAYTTIPLERAGWMVADSFQSKADSGDVRVEEDELVCSTDGDFTGRVILLEQNG